MNVRFITILLSLSICVFLMDKSGLNAYDIGDRLAIKAHVFSLSRSVEGKVAEGKEYAPQGSLLRIAGKSDTAYTVYFYDIPDGDTSKAETEQRTVQTGYPYEVAADVLDRTPAVATGWTAGPMLIPYKFHLKDHSLTGGSTLGAYLGRYLSVYETSAVLFVTGGIAMISMDSGGTSNSGTSSDNVPGFTLAAGLNFTVSRSVPVKTGVVVGVDWAGKKRHYEYEGKPWIALTIGF